MPKLFSRIRRLIAPDKNRRFRERARDDSNRSAVAAQPASKGERCQPRLCKPQVPNSKCLSPTKVGWDDLEARCGTAEAVPFQNDRCAERCQQRPLKPQAPNSKCLSPTKVGWDDLEARYGTAEAVPFQNDRCAERCEPRPCKPQAPNSKCLSLTKVGWDESEVRYGTAKAVPFQSKTAGFRKLKLCPFKTTAALSAVSRDFVSRKFRTPSACRRRKSAGTN
jgi:hypothetical protein